MSDPQQAHSLADRITADLLAQAPHQPHGRELGSDLAAAYQVQDAVIARLLREGSRGAITGYKVAMNSAHLLARYGLSEPVSARIFSAHRHAGATIDLSLRRFRQFAFEPEIAAIIGRTIAPRVGGHDRASIAPMIDRLVPALELLDQRDIVMANATAPDAIAQNIGNAGIAIGGPGVAVAAYEALEITTQVLFDDQEVASVVRGMPQHPLDVVSWMANHLAARGLSIEAGMVILCGTHTPIQYPVGVNRIEVRMSGLGAVVVQGARSLPKDA
jgi:2-keto-4-pentenoate hydratase